MSKQTVSHSLRNRHLRLGRFAGLLAASVLLVLSAIPTVANAGPLASTTKLTVSPSSGLVDGQTVSVVVTGVAAGTYVVVECDPQALHLLTNGQQPEDGCNPLHNAIVGADAGGVIATTMQVQALMTTSLGPADCRTGGCFVAVEAAPGSTAAVPTSAPSPSPRRRVRLQLHASPHRMPGTQR